MLFVGFMLCVSIWEISVRESKTVPDSYHYRTYGNDGFNAATPYLRPTAPVAEPLANVSPSQQHHQPHNITADNDESILIDLNGFGYLINQPKCPARLCGDSDKVACANGSPIVLILVHSAPKNAHKRNVIRETWGQHDARARLYFLLGAVGTAPAQAKLQRENQQYNDIIQGNFIDSYRNITYKHIMALKWFVYNCQHVKYLLKTDDDVFVNTPAMYGFLSGGGVGGKHSFLFCRRLEGSRIKRTYRSKWRVSTKELAGWYYPPYCPGFSVVYSADVVHRLYREAQQTPYFWIDDVHVTGTLVQQLKINITSLGDYYMDREQRDRLFEGHSQATPSQMPMFLFTTPDLFEHQIRALWQMANQSQAVESGHIRQSDAVNSVIIEKRN